MSSKFITLNMLLELPEKILENANSKQTSYLSLLKEQTINLYYYSTLRKDLLVILKEFDEMKYAYSMNDLNYSITHSYEINANKKTSNNSDKVGNYVASKIKSEEGMLNMYNRIMSLANKLTVSESIYFVDTFFTGIGEESISEKLGVSRTYLQKIKKSCLVKAYFEFLDLIKK